jgi:hypothetical protein
VVAGLCVLIVLLVALLLVMRARRERASRFQTAAEAAAGRNPDARPRGQHEQRKPQTASGPVIGTQGSSRSQLALPSERPGTGGGWAATGGWQGGSSLGEMQPPSAEPFRPAIAPPPKSARTAAREALYSGGPPWAPAPEPGHVFGPLPSVPNSAQGPDPGPGIRVPGDMATLPAVPPDAVLPAPFDVSALPDPDFPPRPAAGAEAGPALPTRQSLGFAAAPVPVDYTPPKAPDFTVPSRAAGLVLSADNGLSGLSAASDSSGSSAATGSAGSSTAFRPVTPAGAGPAGDPSYIWDLAATDVFPAAADPGPPTEAPGAVPEDGDPGAS